MLYFIIAQPYWRQAMSEYYRKLDAVVQSRYLVKLKLPDLEEKDDLSYVAIRLKVCMCTLKIWLDETRSATASYDHVRTILRFITWYKMFIADYWMRFRLPVFSAHSNHRSLTFLFVSYRKMVETETFFTNIIGAADNTTELTICPAGIKIFNKIQLCEFASRLCSCLIVCECACLSHQGAWHLHFRIYAKLGKLSPRKRSIATISTQSQYCIVEYSTPCLSTSFCFTSSTLRCSQRQIHSMCFCFL